MVWRWLIGRWQLRDVTRILGDLAAQPAAARHVCAYKVLSDILATQAEIACSPAEERTHIVLSQLRRGREQRQFALLTGAHHGGHPDWAAAALIESFAMANLGSLPKRTSAAIIGKIVEWLRLTLPSSTIAAVERQVERTLASL
jgi:hypothetical protein